MLECYALSYVLNCLNLFSDIRENNSDESCILLYLLFKQTCTSTIVNRLFTSYLIAHKFVCNFVKTISEI